MVLLQAGVLNPQCLEADSPCLRPASFSTKLQLHVCEQGDLLGERQVPGLKCSSPQGAGTV